jgi:hypothetical protein
MGGRVQLPYQAISSAGTTLNQIAATFKLVEFKPGTRNLDIGGGRFDAGTEYLNKKGVENLVYDPFNCSLEHNAAIVSKLSEGPVDTVTVNNVLNVIKESSIGLGIIHKAAMVLKDSGTAYFLIHEGSTKRLSSGRYKRSGDGIGIHTARGWQNYLKTSYYLGEVSVYFDSVSRRGRLIIAKEPVRGST